MTGIVLEVEKIVEKVIDANPGQFSLLVKGNPVKGNIAYFFKRELAEVAQGRADVVDNAWALLCEKADMCASTIRAEEHNEVLKTANSGPDVKDMSKIEKAVLFWSLLPKFQQQLDAHAQDLHPAQVRNYVSEIKRRLSVIERDLVDGKQQETDKAHKVAALNRSLIIEALRDLRKKFREFLEHICYVLLCHYGSFHPDLKGARARLSVLHGLSRDFTALRLLLKELESFLLDLNEAAHAEFPDVEYDHVGCVLREGMQLDVVLRTYKHFLHITRLKPELPEAFFVMRPIPYLEIDMSRDPWQLSTTESSKCGTPSDSDVTGVKWLQRLQRRRSRLAHNIMQSAVVHSDPQHREKLLHSAIKYQETLNQLQAEGIGPEGVVFGWHAKEESKLSAAGDSSMEISFVTFTQAAALSQHAESLLHQSKAEKPADAGKVHFASLLFEDAAKLLFTIESSSKPGIQSPLMRHSQLVALKELMLVQALELKHLSEALNASSPGSVGLLAKQVSVSYAKLKAAEPDLTGCVGDNWEGYAEGKSCLYHAFSLYSDAQALLSWPEQFCAAMRGSDVAPREALGKDSVLNSELAQALFDEASEFLQHLRKPNAFVDMNKETKSSLDALESKLINFRRNARAASNQQRQSQEKDARNRGRAVPEHLDRALWPEFAALFVSHKSIKVRRYGVASPHEPLQVLQNYAVCRPGEAGPKSCQLGCSDSEDEPEVSALNQAPKNPEDAGMEECAINQYLEEPMLYQDFILPSDLRTERRQLGQGGFRSVMLGEMRLKSQKWRQVAIKQFKSPYSVGRVEKDSPDQVRSCISAVDLSRKSPHFIRCFGWSILDDKPALVTQPYLRGTLANLIDELVYDVLDGASILRYASDIAQGMKELHELGIIHEDLKPGNVMISDGNRAILNDSSLSQRTDKGGKIITSDAVGGTYYFMPPEKMQWMGGLNRENKYTLKADIWSFGITLAQLVGSDTLIPYGRGVSPANIIQMLVIDKEIPRVPEAPFAPGLQDLLQSCLSLDPEQRPSAAEIVETLQVVQERLNALGGNKQASDPDYNSYSAGNPHPRVSTSDGSSLPPPALAG